MFRHKFKRCLAGVLTSVIVLTSSGTPITFAEDGVASDFEEVNIESETEENPETEEEREEPSFTDSLEWTNPEANAPVASLRATGEGLFHEDWSLMTNQYTEEETDGILPITDDSIVCTPLFGAGLSVEDETGVIRDFT